MSNCADCGAELKIDESIRHQGKIICGHCFVKMPKEHKIDIQPGEEVAADVLLTQALELLVDHEDRIKNLEEKIELMSVQFDSICG